MTCYFVSDLHGRERRYRRLFEVLAAEPPRALFVGGDLLPGGGAFRAAVAGGPADFLEDFLLPELRRLRERLAAAYPRIFVILGNDDGRMDEAVVETACAEGLWEYLHGRRNQLGATPVYGYAYVPPTPFLLKDWERYDVSQFVDPGCVSPEEGWRSIPVTPDEARFTTIKADLAALAAGQDQQDAVWLFHAPPHQTRLDRAALDGRSYDHTPLDVHVGSIAIRRFIESRQPLVTLHGHVHEAPRLTGTFKDSLGRTVALTAAHDGPELALVRFDPAAAGDATRELLD